MWNEIFNGDCLEVLKGIPDESVNVVFADPPFNLGKKYNGYTDHKEFNEYLQWSEKWIIECCRILRVGGSLFIHNIPKWLTFYSEMLNRRLEFRNWISWDAPSSPMGKSLQPAHYGILYYSKGILEKFYELRYPHKRCRKCSYLLKDYGGKKDTIHPFGPLVSDVWTDLHRIKHNKYRDKHPCQLPIPLLERIILMSSDENDIIYDPFMGTGTTAVAAKRLGRQYCGSEQNREYHESSLLKLDIENELSRIGDKFVGFHLGYPVTIRDADWDLVKGYFRIPEDTKRLDFVKINLEGKNERYLPKSFV